MRENLKICEFGITKIQNINFFWNQSNINSGFCNEPKIANISHCALRQAKIFTPVKIRNAAAGRAKVTLTYQRWFVEVVINDTEWTSGNSHASKVDEYCLLVLLGTRSVAALEHRLGDLRDVGLELAKIVDQIDFQRSVSGLGDVDGEMSLLFGVDSVLDARAKHFDHVRVVVATGQDLGHVW